MGTVFELNRREKFTIDTAKQLLPLVLKITAEADDELQEHLSQIERMRADSKMEQIPALEAEVQILIGRWERKISKLGLEPKGIWLVDFDTGSGFYCWKYPEIEIKFWHGYDDGFSGRKPIENLDLSPES